jgi:hypothetical protein
VPIKPRNRPETDSPHPRKFKNKVEGIMYIIMRKGMAQPIRSRISPRLRSKRGFVIN